MGLPADSVRSATWLPTPLPATWSLLPAARTAAGGGRPQPLALDSRKESPHTPAPDGAGTTSGRGSERRPGPCRVLVAERHQESSRPALTQVYLPSGDSPPSPQVTGLDRQRASPIRRWARSQPVTRDATSPSPLRGEPRPQAAAEKNSSRAVEPAGPARRRVARGGCQPACRRHRPPLATWLPTHIRPARTLANTPGRPGSPAGSGTQSGTSHW